MANAKPRLLDSRLAIVFVTLSYVLGFLALIGLMLFGAVLVIRAEVDRAKSDWELNHQTWVSCGKPWGEPCDCPKEGCLCGIVKGRACGNCRPMGNASTKELAERLKQTTNPNR